MPETPRLQTRIDAAAVDAGRRRAAAVLGHPVNIAHLARAGIVAIARGYVADADLAACLEAAELVPGPTGPRMRGERPDG
jgi:hypothetical protein